MYTYKINQKRLLIFLVTGVIGLVFTMCRNSGNENRVYGNFEAIETIVSAESQGKIIRLDIAEGTVCDSGKIVLITDTVPVFLKLKQAQAQQKAVASKVSNILSQVAVYEEQKKNLEAEKKRTERLLKDNAAPEKQLDDITNSIAVLQKQIESVKTQNAGVLAEAEGMEFSIKQIQDQLSKCYVKNPVKGTVVEKYAEFGESVLPGKALYKIANLEIITLKVYADENQVARIKIGGQCKVNTDDGHGGLKEYTGIISWISSQSEFTPKIIQTREERQNLVYAIKINVPNNGSLKIGMPGELQVP